MNKEKAAHPVETDEPRFYIFAPSGTKAALRRVRLGVVCLVLENRLCEEAEYLAAEIHITDVVHPFRGEADLEERLFLVDTDIKDFFGRNIGVSANGFGNIVLEAHFHGVNPPANHYHRFVPWTMSLLCFEFKSVLTMFKRKLKPETGVRQSSCERFAGALA